MDEMIHQNKLKLAINPAGNRVVWSADGLPLANQRNADYWRIQLDDQERREIMIRSSLQQGTVRHEKGRTEVRYSELVDELGNRYDVGLVINIEQTPDQLELWADIDNQAAVRVNELLLPLIDLSAVCDEQRGRDTLYRSYGLGERLVDPWHALEKGHTEYMAADYNEIWSPMIYPHPCSMCWFGVESAGHFLYVGRHDPDFRTCCLTAGIAPRNHDPRLILSISHYPLVQQGEKLSTARNIVTLQAGDWRIGSDIYSSWARSTWYQVPTIPRWVQEMPGWQRIILKHQFGEIYFKYEDLPRLYQEGRQYGLDTLMVFGWWKGRFDNGYPVYEPDPALGGAEALAEAIATVQKMGGRVALYSNGVLIDIKSDYYHSEGQRICRKDIDGNEYREHYQFANNGTILRAFGYKSFVSACQATGEWRRKLLEIGRTKLAFKPDSIFFDQIGGNRCWLCFDPTHQHGNRGDMDPRYRVENMKAILNLCTGEQAFGTENTVDALAACAHYIHGCDFGNWFAPNVFPEMYRRTFPETIMTNRFIHDCRADWRDQLNFAFIQGHRFDVSIFRGRVAGIAGLPEYARLIGKMTALRQQYRRFFYDGQYVVDTCPQVPEAVRVCEYRHGQERLFACWNSSSADLAITISGQSLTVPAQDVVCLVIAQA